MNNSEQEEVKNEQTVPEQSQKTTVKYDGPIQDLNDPIHSVLKDFFENPFHIKDGKLWLTAGDVKTLTAQMQKLIQTEADGIYAGFQDRVDEEVEDRVNDRTRELEEKTSDVGFTFAQAGKLLEHLKNYREMLQKYRLGEFEIIELKEFEYNISEQIQSKKNW